MASSYYLDEIKQCNEFFNTSNFYEILGLKEKDPARVTMVEISKAYRKSTLTYHPDRVQHRQRTSYLSNEQVQLATKRFQLLVKIYSILNNAEKKEMYDKTYFSQFMNGRAPSEKPPATGEDYDRCLDIPVIVTCPSNDIDPDLKFTSFKAMNLPHELLRNVLSLYKRPLPIQQRAIAHIFDSRDILGWSPTGSGKTAAYIIPLLTFMINEGDFQRRLRINPVKPVTLVLVPTRELADQVAKDFIKLAQGLNAKIVTVYGGKPLDPQRCDLEGGCDILVATPGRLKQLIDLRIIELPNIKYFVLDEADEMLKEKGFSEQVQEIADIGRLPQKHERLTLLFSATFPRTVQILANELLEHDYVHIKVDATKADPRGRYVNQATADRPFVTNPQIKQEVRLSPLYDRLISVVDILIDELAYAFQAGRWTKKILVFDESKVDVENLTKRLNLPESGIVAKTLNANRKQTERESTLEQFRRGDIPVLVATSVAARGLDISGVDLVINFRLPSGYDKKGTPRMTPHERIAAYVQRIGRTGRAGKSGRAISFFDPDDAIDRELGYELLKVLQAAGQNIPGWFLRAFGGRHETRNFLEE